MEHSLLIEMFSDTYKKTVQDNADDFQRVYWLLAKLESLLKLKGVLTDEEVKYLLDLTEAPEPLAVTFEKEEEE